MDFMKWLNSLDELLYEVMSWLIFFPLTLWKTLRHPLAMMDYADRQLALPPEEQYAAAVSPPLFLALALVVAHGVSTALGQSDVIVANRHGLAALVDDQTSALLLRLVIFAMFPLILSLIFVRRRRLPLDRATLRMPFYGQCYPTAAFTLSLSLGTTFASLGAPIGRILGDGLVVGALIYFLAVETRWFAVSLGIGHVRAFGAAMLGLAGSFVCLVLVGFLFTR